MPRVSIKCLFFAIYLIVLNNISVAQTKNEYIQIINRFEKWKLDQYKKGTFATDKNCNFDTVSKAGYKGPEAGIPADVNVMFTDINNDSKLDALITFNPTQCDGGNALMNAQSRVLILSSQTGYIADDTFIDKIESRYKKGWLHVESVVQGTIYGLYLEYKADDGRCCPSVKRTFSISYSDKKLTFE